MSSSTAAVRRHFLSWNRPWIGQATAWLAEGWNANGPLDLSATLAIVPTQQAGRRLREALAGYAEARGSAVFAPRVLTPETLIKQDVGPDTASPLETLLAWADVLRSLELGAFPDVFPVPPPVRNIRWALRLAKQFVRLQVTLGEAGMGVGEVAASAGAEFIEHERWRQIAELAALHARRLAEQQRVEPQAARLDAALHASFERQFKRIAILATPDLPPLVVRRLTHAAIRTSIDVVVFAPPHEAGAFDAWGCPIASVWERRLIDLSEFETRVHLCSDPAMQAARLAGLAAKYRPADNALALGVADPEVAPLLEHELRRLNLPAFNPEGRLLRHERLHALLSCLAEIQRDPAFAAVEALARCPDYLAYLQSEHGPTFSVSRWLKALDDLRARHLPVDLDSAREFAGTSQGDRELAQGLATMVQLRELLRTASFATGAAQVLRQIFAGRQLDRARDEDLRFEDSAVAWTEWLRQCAQAEGSFPGLSSSDWWEIALQSYGDQRSASEKPSRAVELQGWMELLWEDAPHLAIAGANDGHVPEAVPEDSFLPGSLRQRLGLTTNAARFARDAYILQVLAESRADGGRLDLLFGKTTSAGDPLRPSRLLLRCDDAELPRRIGFLFRVPEAADVRSSWTRAWKLIPRVAPPPTRIAGTALKRYLACPFRFYLRHVLGMESVDPLKSELDAFDFGTLCHAALERIGTDSTLRECTDADVLAAELLRHLDRSVRERYGRVLSLPIMVQIESARQRLSKFAELQAGERAAGWKIVAVERSFEIELSGLIVRGKIDRIDRHAGTGAVRVLDYKTSDLPVAPADAHLRPIHPGEPVPAWAQVNLGTKRRAWGDLQLPIYLRAVADEFPGSVASGYFNLPKASGETALALWEDYSVELHESAMGCAEGICAAIRRGEFWPPNESIRAERDECAALFHQGVESSVEWSR